MKLSVRTCGAVLATMLALATMRVIVLVDQPKPAPAATLAAYYLPGPVFGP